MKYVTENETEMIRVVKEKNFSTVSNECFQRDDLSWKAKGIMIYVLTLPNDWKINKIELMNHATDGRDSFNKGWKELEVAGYIETIQIRNEKGVIRGVKYVIREHSNLPFTEKPNTDLPFTDLPYTDLPFTDLPYTDNPPLLITKDTNYLKELNTKDIKDNVTSVPLPVSKEDKYPANEVIDYLNKSANKKFKYTAGHKKHINARFKEGFTLEDFKKVIEVKTHQWLSDAKLNTYLRPETLFGNKMDGYLQEYYKPFNNQKKYQAPQQQAPSKQFVYDESESY